MSSRGPEPESGQRPLPECLTRFLDMPAPAKPRQDRLAQAEPISAEPISAKPARAAVRTPNRALRGTLLWALLYNLIGLTVVALLWQAMP